MQVFTLLVGLCLQNVAATAGDAVAQVSAAKKKRVDGYMTTYQVLEYGNPLVARITERRSDVYVDITAFYINSAGENVKFFSTGNHMHSDMQRGKRIKLHEGHEDLFDSIEAALMANGGAAFESRLLIHVPASEGFGANGSEQYGVPENSDLIYNIKVHNIRHPPVDGLWHHDDPEKDSL